MTAMRQRLSNQCLQSEKLLAESHHGLKLKRGRRGNCLSLFSTGYSVRMESDRYGKEQIECGKEFIKNRKREMEQYI